jgi:hypothetical protein
MLDPRSLAALVEGLGALLLRLAHRGLLVLLGRPLGKTLASLLAAWRPHHSRQSGRVDDHRRALRRSLLCDRGERVGWKGKKKGGESKNYSCIPAPVPEGVWLRVK